MLHDKMGKALINTRIRVLDTAKQYAASRGYQGAMFPWESAMSGERNYLTPLLPFMKRILLFVYQIKEATNENDKLYHESSLEICIGFAFRYQIRENWIFDVNLFCKSWMSCYSN